MILALVITISVIVLTILLNLFLPKISFGKFSIQTFYLPGVFGALLVLLFGLMDGSKLVHILFSSSHINPIQILLLFLSMSFLSIVLDEVGLFQYLASVMIKKAGKKQTSIFIVLYITTSILTIFTSNDVIILTFTPFIIFFCKHAQINPIPYLVEEFVAANTMSMLFVIGNPTNIYLASTYEIDFLSYASKMFIPTFLASITAFVVLYGIFFKELKKEIVPEENDVKIGDKPILITGVICLSTCTILLAISSYIHFQMYVISLLSACILFTFLSVYLCIKRKKEIQEVFFRSIKRIPYSLIPFLLSLFILITVCNEYQIPNMLARILSSMDSLWSYGFSSLMVCNMMNNIPMSIFYADAILSLEVVEESSIYATIIGSNIGAFLTPIGALAGMMWMSILKRYGVHFSFSQFVKYGILIGIPTAFMAFLGLQFALFIGL